MTHIDSLEEFEALVSSKRTALVQFTAKWCKRCPHINEELTRQCDAFQFEWIVVDTENDRDIIEHLGITKLPSICIVQMGDTTVYHEVSIDQVQAIIRQFFPLKMTHDF